MITMLVVKGEWSCALGLDGNDGEDWSAAQLARQVEYVS
jgi:hypothetical protein